MPFRTAMLSLCNQKCKIYGGTVLIDGPKKKVAIAYERCGIESPTRLSITGPENDPAPWKYNNSGVQD